MPNTIIEFRITQPKYISRIVAARGERSDAAEAARAKGCLCPARAVVDHLLAPERILSVACI